MALALSQTATAADPTLTLSYSEETADMMPLWIASDAGYFKEHGLDVTVRYLPAQEGIPALVTGQVQIAAIGGADAVSAVAQGARLKFVLTLTPFYTFQFWVRPQYETADALKGQRVGVASTTGSLYAATVLALRELGLGVSDVVITPLGSVSNVNSSLLAGSIAAAASHAPATYQFERNGFVDLVDLAKKKVPSMNAGLLVPDDFAASHRAEVQAVVDAVVEALRRESADRAYVESEMRSRMKITDPKVADFTYDFYAKEIIRTNPLPEVAQVESNRQAMMEHNPKAASVDVGAMVDQSFVKQAVK
jgi:NitT/TauT family transport system substrate-binding protein